MYTFGMPNQTIIPFGIITTSTVPVTDNLTKTFAKIFRISDFQKVETPHSRQIIF